MYSHCAKEQISASGSLRLSARLFLRFIGLIDVSAHRVGTAFAGIFLFGSALHRPFQCRYRRVLPIIFRVTGIVLFVVGTTWSAARLFQWALPGSLGEDNLMRQATFMWSENLDETIA